MPVSNRKRITEKQRVLFSLFPLFLPFHLMIEIYLTWLFFLDFLVLIERLKSGFLKDIILLYFLCLLFRIISQFFTIIGFT